MPRIVITGNGVVSPIGSGTNEFFSAIENQISGIRQIKNFNIVDYPVKHGAEAKKNGQVILTRPSVDRKELFFKTALEEILANNKIVKNYTEKNILLNVGTGINHFDLAGYINNFTHNNNWEKHTNCGFNSILKIIKDYKINNNISVNISACVASTQAMGLAYRMLKSMKNTLIITGGFDSMLSPLHYMGFYKLGALSSWKGEIKASCRPFDKNRCGLVLGEGAALYQLQRESEANPEDILAEIAGYSSTTDAYLVTDPNPEGTYLAQAALNAINEAGLAPEDIDCVHLHGTGTLKNDIAEAKAMQLIFGENFTKIPVFSLKGQIGHLIGACGAMEILAVIYSLQKQEVPVTVNFFERDPDVPLNVVNDKPLRKKIKNILKLNAAFGGQNTAFILKKYEN